MFHFILFIIACAYFLYRLITYKPIPPNSRIDWDKEAADRAAGVPWDERQKKFENGEYWTTSPKPKPVEHLPKVVDIKRYQHDLETLPKDYVEHLRDIGNYMFISNV